MHHSQDALDRTGGVQRAGLLSPLRHRDFRLLWTGMCLSLVGDGAFLVALSWHALSLAHGPTGMSLVGIAMTIPTIAFLLIGGVASDRLNRRAILVGADLLRGCAVGAMAALTLAGAIHLWQLVALAAVYGAGTAFHAPAFDAFVPDVLAGRQLAQANALDQLVRPLTMRLAGPALGGVLVGAGGAGAVYLADAASFACATAAVLATRARPERPAPAAGASVLSDLRDGWRFVRQHAWLWATFASAAVAYLLFMGPVEVLLPWLVQHALRASAVDLGLVYAAGGLMSMLCAIAIGQRGLPRRAMTSMLLLWTVATLAVAGYGMADAVWQLMLAAALFNGLETAGTIIWATLKQEHVPAALLGRVSSLDWLISIGLLPLSFALTGPVSAAIGVRATLIGAGVLGAIVTYATLHVPGVRQPSGQPAHGQHQPGPAAVAEGAAAS